MANLILTKIEASSPSTRHTHTHKYRHFFMYECECMQIFVSDNSDSDPKLLARLCCIFILILNVRTFTHSSPTCNCCIWGPPRIPTVICRKCVGRQLCAKSDCFAALVNIVVSDTKKFLFWRERYVGKRVCTSIQT